jgi:hypothetical protein
MTIARTSRWSILTLLAVALMAPAARAQEIAGSFDQLRVLVKKGDTIAVTDNAGATTHGRLTELSPASLALLVDGRPRVIEAADISTISQRRSDSLANGAGWGLGIGAVLGLAVGISLESSYDEDANGALAVTGAITYGALGAGMGAGIDALIKSPMVIFARPRSTSPPVVVAPMVGRRTGVVVTVNGLGAGAPR